MEIVFLKPAEFEKWIGRLAAADRGKAMHVLTMLEEADRPLGMPHGKDLKDGLWELRSPAGQRIYYAMCEERALVLTQGRKDTQKRDIERARRRMA